jgi:ABC-type multidrug transport system ATPase subunit
MLHVAWRTAVRTFLYPHSTAPHPPTSQGECFGLLGPNGAGKSTSINMMTGFMEPSGGTAVICGKDIRTAMNEIYTIMGVCPQHDLLWETLTGAAHARAHAAAACVISRSRCGT